MPYNINTVALKIRLLLLTMLITVAGFALVSHFSNSSSYGDDTPRVRVIEMQEFHNDAEPLLNSVSFDFLITDFSFFCIALIFYSIVNRSKVVPRFTFFYHIQPRSPPL